MKKAMKQDMQDIRDEKKKTTLTFAPTKLPFPSQLVRPRHHEIHNPSRQNTFHPDLFPIPAPATPFPAPTPPLPIRPPILLHRRRVYRVERQRGRANTPTNHTATRAGNLPTRRINAARRLRTFFPPQITRHPNLHTAAHTRCRADNRPAYHGPLLVLEDREREVGCGPTDALQREQTHEGRQGRVIQTPSGQQTGGEAETLVACEECLWRDEYNAVNRRWAKFKGKVRMGMA